MGKKERCKVGKRTVIICALQCIIIIWIEWHHYDTGDTDDADIISGYL